MTVRLLRRRRAEPPTNAGSGDLAAEQIVLETPEQLLLRIEFRVLRRLDGLLQGANRTLFYGSGLDFADLREYQFDDDVRHIDWNVTARLDTPHVRTFHEDRDLTAWFLVDRSGSMDFGSSGRSKAAAANEFVTAMARLLSREGNRIGAILYDQGVERVVEPSTGRRHVLHLARETMRPVQRERPVATTDLTGLIDAALERVRRRSLVFVVSDFMSAPGWEERLGLLGRRHDVVAIRVVDQSEDKLPDAGLVAIADAETGEQVVVDTADPGFRRRFAEVSAARERAFSEAFRSARSDVFTLATDGAVIDTLLEMAASRGKGRR